MQYIHNITQALALIAGLISAGLWIMSSLITIPRSVHSRGGDPQSVDMGWTAEQKKKFMENVLSVSREEKIEQNLKNILNEIDQPYREIRELANKLAKQSDFSKYAAYATAAAIIFQILAAYT